MSLTASKPAEELRETWQSKALEASRGKMRKVLITALTKEYPGAMDTLLRATFPGFVDLSLPIFLSYAEIYIDGSIVCDMMDKGRVRKKTRVYDSEDAFIYEMRKLADKLKLDDKDRIEMFTVLQKWVARDRRTGIFGQKLDS